MTGATRLTHASWNKSWAGNPLRPLRPASARRCSGIWITRSGLPMCRAGATATGWLNNMEWKQYETQGHHPRRGLRHPLVPGHASRQQATAADLRQADDLLPLERAAAGGYSRGAGDLHATRHAAL